ncbi:MAG: F0F1 ATP synthase subunit alpha [Spirochaetaceae bacterium]|nr:F0F1 ATP synthase subunit alpha [Spirochaetaceae bacterium]MDE0229437.1 F0F1 ATP synthase subunit alpha [Spirochaetaceae bacterium]MDE0445337.1 F0F1 ATP synthase subunit alpha [Spirochaetaceae bacterium]
MSDERGGVSFKLDRITSEIRRRIERFEAPLESSEVGTVLSVGDGIARISGLSGVMATELLEFPGGVQGIALNLEPDEVGAVIVGEYAHIEEGALVKGTGRIASIPVSDDLIGRVVNANGVPVDGQGPIRATATMAIERVAPGVVERVNVDTPVQTGIKAIDSMTPIGRGQRQLVIGDRQTGKTALAVDTIINQKGKDLICVYVAIGQRQGQVAQVVATLREHDAMEHTIVVVAGAADSAPQQYVAPYAGCAIGEHFMEQGRDVLVVYDDLSKHAWAYRQISLLLRRPPGREAYPGDVFYLHSRLLERAARLSPERGGGSLTALPIIETLAGDVSAYIPTNVISITDGQIYLESDLFYAGQRPAVNVGLSVSRVGGDAQTRAMKQVAGQLRLDLAQYYALAAFAQFGSDLDQTTRGQLERGQRLTELLKQPQYRPQELAHQVIGIFALTRGFANGVPASAISGYAEGLVAHIAGTQPAIIRGIDAELQLTEEIEASLSAAVRQYTRQAGYEVTEGQA